jgi:hypothetical protein
MIPFWKVRAIEVLLAERVLSQRNIARRLCVGRGVVAGIAHGTRPDYETLRRRREPDSTLPAQRCRDCGALVHPPCIACRARRQLARQHGLRRPATAGNDGEILQVRLSGSERLRYERLRARQVGDRRADDA